MPCKLKINNKDQIKIMIIKIIMVIKVTKNKIVKSNHRNIYFLTISNVTSLIN